MPEITREEFQQANRDQLNAIQGLATEIRGLAQSVLKNRMPADRMSPTTWLVLMGALASFGAFIANDLTADIHTLGDAMKEDNHREALDAGRMARHQTGIEVNAGNVCILWRQAFPTLPCPEPVQQPPIP